MNNINETLSFPEEIINSSSAKNKFSLDLINIIDDEKEEASSSSDQSLIAVDKLFSSNLPTGRPHISYSELHDWIECNWRHKVKYIDKISYDSESIHTLYGQMIHAGVESYVSVAERIPIDADKFVKQWHEELIPTFIDRMKVAGNQKAIDDYTKSKEEFDNSIKPILEFLPVWLDKTFPDWTIYGAEIKLYENVGEREDRFFKGFIDCVIKVPKKKNKEEFEYYLLDWKSTSWGWAFEKKTNFNKQLQLILYKHFFSKKNNIPLKDIKCGFVLLKRKPSKGDITQCCEYVNVSVGPKTETRALEYIDRMFGHLKKGLFPKNRNSCKYCMYKNTEQCT